MARRRQSGAAEDLMDLVAMLPWWAGLVLAFACYWVLHEVAVRPIAADDSTQVGGMITAAFWQGLATAGQYVLPLICLAGAFISAARRRRRRSLFENASTSDSEGVLNAMSWQQFELLVGEGFRRRGYFVKEVGGGGADGGVDLVLIKAGKKSFVQCKQWKSAKVGVSTIRELYGVMTAERAEGGFVITSGRFTPDAVAFAKKCNIRLMDGPALMKLLREARSSKMACATQPSHQYAVPETPAPTSSGANLNQPPAPTPMQTPACPKCGKAMLRRIAKQGAHAGKAFWGCPDYSSGCRGIRAINGP